MELYTNGYQTIGGIAIVAGIILIVLSPMILKLMKDKTTIA
jgi:hypothetical protein